MLSSCTSCLSFHILFIIRYHYFEKYWSLMFLILLLYFAFTYVGWSWIISHSFIYELWYVPVSIVVVPWLIRLWGFRCPIGGLLFLHWVSKLSIGFQRSVSFGWQADQAVSVGLCVFQSIACCLHHNASIFHWANSLGGMDVEPLDVEVVGTY